MGGLILKEGHSNNEKKVYVKPAINTIKLVADEAVLSLCKFNHGATNIAECGPDTSCVSTWRS